MYFLWICDLIQYQTCFIFCGLRHWLTEDELVASLEGQLLISEVKGRDLRPNLTKSRGCSRLSPGHHRLANHTLRLFFLIKKETASVDQSQFKCRLLTAAVCLKQCYAGFQFSLPIKNRVLVHWALLLWCDLHVHTACWVVYMDIICLKVWCIIVHFFSLVNLNWFVISNTSLSYHLLVKINYFYLNIRVQYICYSQSV